jgi:hypothetical protein
MTSFLNSVTNSSFLSIRTGNSSIRANMGSLLCRRPYVDGE